MHVLRGHEAAKGSRGDTRLVERPHHWILVTTTWVLAAGTAVAQMPASPRALGLPDAAEEIVSARTETAKQFALPDGTNAGLFFTHPIHYRDAGGQWQDIDLSFRDDGAGGQIADRNRITVRVPASRPFVDVTDTEGNGIRWLTSGPPAVAQQHAQYRDAQGIEWTYTATA